MPRQSGVIEPLQKRSQRTQEALLEAAEHLTQSTGFDQLTVADIASQAGCSVGAFYRRFRDKDALLDALHERLTERGEKMLRVLERDDIRALPVRQVMRQMARLMIAGARLNQPFYQIILSRARVDPQFAGRILRIRRLSLRLMKLHLRPLFPQIRHPNPEQAVDFMLRQIRATASSRVETNLFDLGDTPITDEQFIDEMLCSAFRYLGLPDE